MILRWPEVIGAGGRYRQPVRLIDVMPTILDQLGLPEVPGVQGRSLVAQLRHPQSSRSAPAFAEGISKRPEQKALYEGDWKLLLRSGIGRRSLFNIALDPGEQRDRAQDEVERTSRMIATLTEQLKRNEGISAGRVVDRVELTPEQRKTLEALGYLR